jgi:hypothetical protein
MTEESKNSRAFLTTKQLAERWGMAHRTLENWRQRKIGPRYLKLEHGAIRYAIADIANYERTNKVLR